MQDQRPIGRSIAAFSRYFSKNFRITLLLMTMVVIVGYLSYTHFLKREGLPAIEIPIAVVQTEYFGHDELAVDRDITIPLASLISELPEVRSTSSQSYPNMSVIQVNFAAGINSTEGVRILRSEVRNAVALPDEANTEFIAINAGSFDGQHDLVLTLFAKDVDILEVQETASRIADRFEHLNEVRRSTAISNYAERIHPNTGQSEIQRQGINRIGIKDNGALIFSEAIAIGVVKVDSVSIVEVSKAIQAEIEHIRQQGELEGYTIASGLDMAQSTVDQINELESAALSSLFAVIAVLFFLLNWRASIIGALFVPIVFSATFIGLYAAGYELNTMVLFGLILVLGLFVDDAIVVVEAIDYHKRKGERGTNAVYSAIRDIGLPDILGTLTTLLVFVPMALISGIMGDFIRFIPITVIIALTLSLFCALTIITFLSGLLVPDYANKRNKSLLGQILDTVLYKPGDIFNSIGNIVGSWTSWYLLRPTRILSAIAICFVFIGIGGYYSGQIKFSIFAPPKDSNSIFIHYNFSDGTTLEDQEAVLIDIEGILQEHASDWINEAYIIGPRGLEAFQLVSLEAMSERTTQASDIVQVLNRQFEDIDQAVVKSAVYSAGPPDYSEFKFFVQVYADDQEVLASAAEDIRSFLDGRTVLDNEMSFDSEVEYLSSIARRNGERYAQVKAKVSDTQNTAILIALEEEVRREYDDVKLEALGLNARQPISFDLGLETELMGSFDSAVFYFLVSLLAMYVLLVLLYNSFSLPLLVLLAIPFSFTGVFPGLYATGNELSFFVVIGLIALSGIVVNNTIMLLDFANRKRAIGISPREAIASAISIRFRPIITTTVTTIAALIFLPIVDPFWEPLVYTILFGLTASTILVVIVFPSFYCAIEYLRAATASIMKRIIQKVS